MLVSSTALKGIAITKKQKIDRLIQQANELELKKIIKKSEYDNYNGQLLKEVFKETAMKRVIAPFDRFLSNHYQALLLRFKEINTTPPSPKEIFDDSFFSQLDKNRIIGPRVNRQRRLHFNEDIEESFLKHLPFLQGQRNEIIGRLRDAIFKNAMITEKNARELSQVDDDYIKYFYTQWLKRRAGER